MPKVKVIDSVMGSGKTTKMFEHMRRNPDKKYLYISPFLSEVGDGNTREKGRIQKELPELNFVSPRNTGLGKQESLRSLLINGKNIASTHALFTAFDYETTDLLKGNNYTLVIDESVDVVHQYKDIGKDDIEMLFRSGMVTTEGSTDQVRKDGFLVWNSQKYNDYEGERLADIKSLCEQGVLYYYGGSILIWEMNRNIIDSLPEVYIMTYIFEGTSMKCWLDFNNIPYGYEDNTAWGLKDSKTIKDRIRKDLTVLKTPKKAKDLNTSKYAFSKGWYNDHSNKKEVKYIKESIVSIVSSQGCKSEEVFWTTFKDFQGKLKGKGYSRTNGSKIQPFLVVNSRATNDYKHKKLCIYPVAIFKNPIEKNYINKRGSLVDEGLYSLGEMLQFIFRGNIREEDGEMAVVVFSDYMRELLLWWLEQDW